MSSEGSEGEPILKIVEYCKLCTMPFEYCEFGPSAAKCKAQLLIDNPTLHEKLYTTTTAAPAATTSSSPTTSTTTTTTTTSTATSSSSTDADKPKKGCFLFYSIFVFVFVVF